MRAGTRVNVEQASKRAMRGPTHLRYGEAPPMGAAKPELQRPWNDRRFPSLGVTQMPANGRPPFRGGVDIKGGHEFDTHNACLSEGGVLAVVGGLSRDAAADAGQHGFPAAAAKKRSEAAPRASPPSPGVTACRAREVLVERATPPFSALVRHGGRQKWTGVRTAFAPLAGRSLSPQ